MEPFLVVIGFVILAIVVRLIAGSFDGERVEAYVKAKGWELVDRSWDPLGPGWFGEKNARIYRIMYRDTQGNLHQAHVKTSMLSGVYLTNDQIVEDRPDDSRTKEQLLAEENERLRNRLKELERGET